MRTEFIVAAIAGLSLALLPVEASAQFRPSPERQAKTESDYRATLGRLGITDMRTGADGFNRSAPNAANFDEAKAGLAGPLPALLPPGRHSARWWWNVRRPQLARLLEDEMYGRVPATAPRVRWVLASTEQREKWGVPAVVRYYRGEMAGNPRPMELSVTVPRSARGRVPLVLELGFPEDFRFGNFPTLAEQPNPWTAQLLRRGWAYAILNPVSVQPDDGAGLSEGVIGAASLGRPRGEHDWGALRAWAWGASRAFDLLAADPRIDSRRIAIEGLSRYGKAALVAMAFDRRFSIGFIGSSGAGGAKLLRRDFGERVENLTASGEYHWFAPAFLRYGGPRSVRDLPVDAHMLIALAAPRPLFISAGNFSEDGWVDPNGSFVAAREASAAWRLLGAQGLSGPATMPAIGELRDQGLIAFRQHEGGHTTGPNWPSFIRFADRVWFKR